MSWSNAYIGTPYLEHGRDAAGCDCWGLARLVYAQELDISLPSYAGRYSSVEEHAELQALISDVTACGTWVAIDGPIQPYDLLVFSRGHHQTHIGISIRGDLMLHMVEGDQAKVETFKSGRWGNRLKGIYRHFKTASEGSR